MKQLALPLQELCKYPYWCPHEMECIDPSDKGNLKSCCDLTMPTVGHPTWTNCRTWGRCTMRGDVFGHQTGGDA